MVEPEVVTLARVKSSITLVLPVYTKVYIYSSEKARAYGTPFVTKIVRRGNRRYPEIKLKHRRGPRLNKPRLHRAQSAQAGVNDVLSLIWMGP